MEFFEIRAKIKELLVEVLNLDVAPTEIGDNDLLFEGELGNESIAALEIVTAIEDLFDIEIDDETINLEFFESIDTLARETHRLCLEGR